jgi:peptide/nickel transport system substrate-binding protein
MTRGVPSRVVVSLLLLAGVLTFVAACGRQAAQPTAQAPSGSRTLVRAGIDSPNNDPAVAITGSALNVVLNTYEGLVRFKYGGLVIEPALAQSWEIRDGGKVYRFKLRRGVKFHDGTTFNAEAVKFSYDRIKEMEKGPSIYLTNYTGARVIDDSTVEIHLDNAVAPFLMMLPRLLIVSPTAVRANVKDNDSGSDYLQENSAGTGPFKIESWTRGREMVLVKFDDYWQGWPSNHLERVRFIFGVEPATARLMLEQGDVDIIHHFSLDDLPAIEGNPDLVVHNDPSITVLYLHMATHKGPLKDLRVRQAVSHTFDYEGFITRILRGTGSRARGPVAIDVPFHNKDLPVFNQDLARARELLQEAGHPRGGFTLSMVNIPMFEDRRQMALMLKADLDKLGVGFNYREAEVPSWYAALRDEKSGPDTYIMGNYPAFPDADAFLWRFFHSTQTGEGGLNYSFYRNRNLDSLLQQGRIIVDENQRRRVYEEAQNVIVRDHVALWVTQPNFVSLQRAWVKNYKSVPSSFETYYYYPMYLEGKPGR